MFAFSQVEPNTAGQVDKLDVPLTKYLDAAFSQGWHDTMFDSIRRMEEYRIENGEDGGKLLDPDEANMLYSTPNLRFDKPIRENQAKLLQNRMQEQNYRATVMGSTSFLSGRGALGFGAMLIANMSNPLDFAVNLMPFVGEAKVAANIRHLRWLRGPLNRGLITVEQIAGSKIPLVAKYPKFAQSVIDATVGQMVAEVPTAMAYKQDKLDYTIENFLLNTAMGAAFGAGFHVTIAGAKRLWGKLNPTVKEKMAEKATADFLNDKDIDIAPVARLSDEAVFRKVWDEGNAKLRAMVTNHPEYRKFANELFQQDQGQNPITFDSLTRDLLVYPDYKIYVDDFRFNNPGETPLTQAAFNAARKKNLAKLPEPLRQMVQEAWVSGKGVVGANFHDPTKPKGIRVTEAGVEEFAPLVETPETKKLAAQKRAEFFAQPEVRELLDNKRRELVDQVADKWREKFDPQKRFDEIKQAELQKLQKDGQMLPPEKIAQHTHEHPAVDEGVAAAIAKEADDLQKELGIETPEKVEQPDVLDRIDNAFTTIIKALEPKSKNMNLDPFLIETVGKPVLHAMFKIIQKIFRETRNFERSLDEAMRYYHNVKAKNDIPALEAAKKEATPEQRKVIDERITAAKKVIEETEPYIKEKTSQPVTGTSRRNFLKTLAGAIAGLQAEINPINVAKEVLKDTAPKTVTYWAEATSPALHKAGQTLQRIGTDYGYTIKLYKNPKIISRTEFEYSHSIGRMESTDDSPLPSYQKENLRAALRHLGLKINDKEFNILYPELIKRNEIINVNPDAPLTPSERLLYSAYFHTRGIDEVPGGYWGSDWIPVEVPLDFITNIDALNSKVSELRTAIGRLLGKDNIVSERYGHYVGFQDANFHNLADVKKQLDRLKQDTPGREDVHDLADELYRTYEEGIKQSNERFVESHVSNLESDELMFTDQHPKFNEFAKQLVFGERTPIEQLLGTDTIAPKTELLSKIREAVLLSKLHEKPKERIKSEIDAIIKKSDNIRDMIKRSVLEEANKPAETIEKIQPDVIDQALSKVIKALDMDPAKMHIDPLLIETVGKPVLKAMFQVIQKIYRTARDLKPAVEEAMKYYHAAKAQADLNSLREQQAVALPEAKPQFDEAIKIAEKRVKETAIQEPKDETPAEKKSKGMTRRSFIGAISKAVAAMQVPVNPVKIVADAMAPVKAAEKMRKFFVEIPNYGDMAPGMFTMKNRKLIFQLSKNVSEDDSFVGSVNLVESPSYYAQRLFKAAYHNMRFENRMGESGPLDIDLIKGYFDVNDIQASVIRRRLEEYASSKVPDPKDLHSIDRVLMDIETSMIIHSTPYGQGYLPQYREVSIPESMITSTLSRNKMIDAEYHLANAIDQYLSKHWKNYDKFQALTKESDDIEFREGWYSDETPEGLERDLRILDVSKELTDLEKEQSAIIEEALTKDSTLMSLSEKAKKLKDAFKIDQDSKLIETEEVPYEDDAGTAVVLRGNHPSFEKIRDSMSIGDELLNAESFVPGFVKPSELLSVLDKAGLSPELKQKVKSALEGYMDKPVEQVNIPDMLHRSILEELHKAKDAEFVAKLDEAKPEAVDIALTCIIGQL